MCGNKGLFARAGTTDHKAKAVAFKGNNGDVWEENFTRRPFPKGLS